MKSIRSAALQKKLSSSRENFDDNPVGSRVRGLELDLRLREFEINQLTQRNNFFMIFQGVLIAGLIQSLGIAAPIITFCMAALGMAISVFQIGMAGGAKYWQSRWEASTRSSEIAIVLELLKANKLAVQTFTLDSNLLTKDEQKQVEEWNAKQSNFDEKINSNKNYIHSVVMADINSAKYSLRKCFDWWIRKYAIAPKWSVSRIPIWVGASLFVFWIIIFSHTFYLPKYDFSAYSPKFFELAPLKFDEVEK
jgi:hypothetical protein